MPALRPRLPPRPCPACGDRVDPLRAGATLALASGYRYLCDASCRDAFRDGERSFEEKPKPVAPAKPPASTQHTHPELAPSDKVELPAIPLAVGALALSLAMVPNFVIAAGTACVLTVGLSIYTLVWTFPRRADLGLGAWVLGPLGAILAAIGGGVMLGSAEWPWFVVPGAVVASIAMVLRFWFDALMRKPVDDAVIALRSHLPMTMRIDLRDPERPTESVEQVVKPAVVRAGQEFLVGAGEVVGADGVIMNGKVWALTHPEARTPTRKRPGDGLLAGARIIEGDARVLVGRTGEDRALARTRRAGALSGRDAAPVAKIVGIALRWGAVIVPASAIFTFFIVGQDLAAGLRATAAILVAAPFLAARRASAAPLIAATTRAAARGIVYRDGRALDAAGRVATTALCVRGTVTDGRPALVEAAALDSPKVEPFLALAAGAELSATEHPLSRGLVTQTRDMGIEPAPVRRAMLHTGRGVTAMTLDGDEIVVGNRQFLITNGISVAAADAETTIAESRGDTALIVAVGGRPRAVLHFREQTQAGARAAVQTLSDLGSDVALLSGDHRRTVEVLAQRLDVQNVKAELTPDEKAEAVRNLREPGSKVAVLGKADDDMIALSAADVPVVLAAAGTPSGELGVSTTTSDIRDGTTGLLIAATARNAVRWVSLFTLVSATALLAAAVLGWAGPGIGACVAFAIDLVALPSGRRVLARIDSSAPARA